jgi:hypothetical protein
LKLRDRAPSDVEVSAVIVGGRECEPIVRAVAALCPRRTLRLHLPTDAMWDARPTDNGAPGPRDFAPNYYAAFVIDPDGNNIEAASRGA